LPHTDLEIDGVKEYIFDTIRGAGWARDEKLAFTASFLEYEHGWLNKILRRIQGRNLTGTTVHPTLINECKAHTYQLPHHELNCMYVSDIADTVDMWKRVEVCVCTKNYHWIWLIVLIMHPMLSFPHSLPWTYFPWWAAEEPDEHLMYDAHKKWERRPP
jgi:hypothetical protein